MGVIKEFQEFAMRGNVVDLAVGVIMGAAFGPIVSTLVDNVIMPPIGNAIIKFVLTAFAIFILVKAMNTAKKRFEKPAPGTAAAAPPPPPPTEVYLKEIRDLLAARS
jgi:large conductance mechanosensitive channel